MIPALLLRQAWAWLCHRSFWQLVSMALGILLVVQHMQLAGEKRHSHKLSERVTALTQELQRISTVKNEQKVVTQEKLRVVTKTIHDAEKQAEKVEHAPLPGQCRTPKEILDADI